MVDARGQVLGHLTRGIASTLTGELKPIYTSHLDIGDHVVVINAKDICVSGEKMSKKLYHSHTGWPGGLTTVNLKSMIDHRPEEVIRLAVYGMMPKNKLRRNRISRLHIFADDKHPYDENLIRYYEDPGLASFSSREMLEMDTLELLESHDKVQRLKIQELLNQYKSK